jgi:biotin operon repressor
MGAWHGVWLDERLTHLAVRLWAVLSLECGAGDSCRIGLRLVARALRTSRENVEAALEQLRTAGYVLVERDGSALAVTLVPDQWATSRATAEVASLC